MDVQQNQNLDHYLVRKHIVQNTKRIMNSEIIIQNETNRVLQKRKFLNMSFFFKPFSYIPPRTP